MIKIENTQTDETILAEIGARLSRQRLNLGLTQAELAEQAGLAKRTLERVEAGDATKTSSLIRILRVLELLPGLDSLIPGDQDRPMDLLKQQGKIRQRASKKSAPQKPDDAWSWGDDT